MDGSAPIAGGVDTNDRSPGRRSALASPRLGSGETAPTSGGVGGVGDAPLRSGGVTGARRSRRRWYSFDSRPPLRPLGHSTIPNVTSSFMPARTVDSAMLAPFAKVATLGKHVLFGLAYVSSA